MLFTFVLFHFINIGFGLISPDLMEQGQALREVITRSTLGGIILYAALFAHMGLSISKLAGRRTLKMPIGEAIQIAMGLIIPLLLTAHIVHTRMASALYDVDDEFGYISVLLWGTWDGFMQALLLLIVWVHGCLGLHFWLSNTRWWHRWWNVLVGVAVFVPGFALAGFLTEGRRVLALFQDEATRVPLMQQYNWPSQETFGVLIATTNYLLMGFWAILGLAALVSIPISFFVPESPLTVFLLVAGANFVANIIRNIWAFVIIFCGHFPADVYNFTEEQVEGESR
ncbi:MAG: hypothetical protein COC12_04510, partial [Rhodobacteraceae bacterium]